MGNESSTPSGINGEDNNKGAINDGLSSPPLQSQSQSQQDAASQQQQGPPQKMGMHRLPPTSSSASSASSSAKNSILATLKSSHTKLIRQNQKVKLMRQQSSSSTTNNNNNNNNNNNQHQHQHQQKPPSSANHNNPQHTMNVFYSYGSRNDSSDHGTSSNNYQHPQPSSSSLEDDMRHMSLQHPQQYQYQQQQQHPQQQYHSHSQQQQQQQQHPLRLMSQQQQQSYVQQQQQQQQQQQRPPVGPVLSNDEDDWNRAWELDDESSDDTDDDEDDGGDQDLVVPSVKTAMVTPAVPDLFRTSMDGGHSSSSPIKHNHSKSYHPTATTTTTTTATATATATAKATITTDDQELRRQADRALLQGSNAVRWDMTPRAGMDYEKPNVKMFSPFLRVLGKGAFGKVVLVQKQTGDEQGNLFAMKILRKSHLVRQKQIERTKTERKVLTMIDHPFIMKLHYAFQTDDKLYLVLDYSAGGELFFHLSRHRQFPEWVAKFYAAELLLALSHMHLNGILYRDLKPENVLLDAEGHVKLGDFGLAKDNIQHAYKGANSVCGTPEYMAPEILNQVGHGYCVDYWGLGMLIYEMMTGLPPWYTQDREKLFERLRFGRLRIPTYFSPEAAQCVSALLQKNPRNRLGVMGVRSVIAHPFFATIDFRALRAKAIQPPIRPMEGFTNNNTINNTTTNNNPNHPNYHNHTSPQHHPQQHHHPQQQQQHPKQQQHPQKHHPPTPLSDANIDQVTKCFDEKFTRMPVESTELDNGNASPSERSTNSDDLNDQTFVGFTFDEATDSDERQQIHTTHPTSNNTRMMNPNNNNGHHHHHHHHHHHRTSPH